jgi:outer membrane protein assembly factor BamA
LKSGPLTRLVGSYGISQTENPHFLADDRRTAFNVRAERRLFSHLTLGAGLGHDDVRFAPEDTVSGPANNDHFWSTGADVTFDTRIDPSFPVDAVLASASVERLTARGSRLTLAQGSGAQGVNRYRLSVAGYKRVFRQIVFAAHTGYDMASASLPDYEEWLLGGSSLRGTRAGTFAGDTRLLWGGEVRAPIGSPLDLAKLGVNAFLDGGSVAPHGQSISHSTTERGAGAGLFIIATVVRLNFEVAHSLNHRGTRFRFGMGFTF